MLVIEDDVPAAQDIAARLNQAGFCAVVAPSAYFAVVLARRLEPRLVVLSLSLHDADPLRVLSALRQHEVSVPIAVVVEEREDAGAIAARRGGAAALLERARLPDELVRCARTLVPVTGVEPTTDTSPAGALAVAALHRFDDVVIDVARRRVTRGGQPLPLTPREFDLLLCLVRRRGAVVSRAELLHEVWRGERGDARAVDRHVLLLRRKLEPAPATPRYILTAWKAGYRFAARMMPPDGNGGDD